MLLYCISYKNPKSSKLIHIWATVKSESEAMQKSPTYVAGGGGMAYYRYGFTLVKSGIITRDVSKKRKVRYA